MFNLAKARQLLDDRGNDPPSGLSLTWTTPVHFDATLVVRLIDQHRELNVRLGEVVAEIGRDPAAAESAVRDCANQLHELRRAEALWLYPVIARELMADPMARRQFSEARLAMLSLARRLLRRFDELVRAIQSGKEIRAAAVRVVKALAAYRRRNEAQIYPLYSLMERLYSSSGSQVA
jgi:hypothetical protein